MTGYPQIQSYIGANDTGYGLGNTGGGLALSGDRLIVLKTGTGAAGYIIVYDIETGAEVNFATATTINGAAVNSVTNVWTITSAGLIVMKVIDNGNGTAVLATINQTTLRQVAAWNISGVGPPSGGFGVAFLSPMLSPDNINFVFGPQPAGGLNLYQADGTVLQFAGHAFATDEPFTSSCGGATKNVMYSACHHTYSTTLAVGFYKTTISSGAGGYNVATWPGTPNANIATTKIGTILPSAIDATWTSFSTVSPLGVDASDGHLIVQFGTTDAVTNQHYVAKINETTLAIIWQTAGVTASAGVSQPNNALVWTDTHVLHSVDLSTGAHTATTPYGQPSVDWSQIGQFYDYHKNSIFTWGEYTNGGQPPYPVTGTTSWGATADHWYRIILGTEPPLAEFGTRRFIAMCTPLRV